jgi:predicted outer membrane repeat protein
MTTVDFSQNSASFGGALSASSTKIDAVMVTMSGNAVDGAGNAPGGGMDLHNCTLVMRNSSILRNSCDGGGGAIKMHGTTALLDNMVMDSNVAGGPSSGGALSIADQSIVELHNPITSSEGKSRVELALGGIYGCGCGQNFAPQYPPVIYKPNRKSPGASIRGVRCQRHQQWAAWVHLGLLGPAGALAAAPRQRKLHPRNVLRRPCLAGRALRS